MSDETPEPEVVPEPVELEPEQDAAAQIVNEIEKVKLSNPTLSRDAVKALGSIQTRIRSLASLAEPKPPTEPDYKPVEPEPEVAEPEDEKEEA